MQVPCQLFRHKISDLASAMMKQGLYLGAYAIWLHQGSTVLAFYAAVFASYGQITLNQCVVQRVHFTLGYLPSAIQNAVAITDTAREG